MVDYVDIQETFLVAGDYDSRKRYLRQSAGGDLVVCSGVTWSIGSGRVHVGQSWMAWRWALGSRESVGVTSVVIDGSTISESVAAPAPANITECTI